MDAEVRRPSVLTGGRSFLAVRAGCRIPVSPPVCAGRRATVTRCPRRFGSRPGPDLVTWGPLASEPLRCATWRFPGEWKRAHRRLVAKRPEAAKMCPFAVETPVPLEGAP